MTLADFIAITDRHYPDGMIRQHWDSKKKRPVSGSKGDSLAFSIVSNLSSTFQPKAEEDLQFEVAISAIDSMVEELLALSRGLGEEAHDRRRARAERS